MFMKLSLFEKKPDTKKPLDDPIATTSTTTTHSHSRESPPNPTPNRHEHKHDLRHILQQYTLCLYLHRTALLVIRAFLRCTPSITLSPLSLHFTNNTNPNPGHPLLPLLTESPSLSSLSNVECSPTPDIKQMC